MKRRRLYYMIEDRISGMKHRLIRPFPTLNNMQVILYGHVLNGIWERIRRELAR